MASIFAELSAIDCAINTVPTASVATVHGLAHVHLPGQAERPAPQEQLVAVVVVGVLLHKIVLRCFFLVAVRLGGLQRQQTPSALAARGAYGACLVTMIAPSMARHLEEAGAVLVEQLHSFFSLA